MLANRRYGAWKRRHRLEVIACILREAGEWSSRTRLVYRTSLNFRVLGKYLGFLLERGLVEERQVDQVKLYHTTRKGELWLSLYKRMLRLLE